MDSTEKFAKLFALRDAISKALKEDSLDSKINEIRLQAKELALDELTLSKMIMEQRQKIGKPQPAAKQPEVAEAPVEELIQPQEDEEPVGETKAQPEEETPAESESADISIKSKAKLFALRETIADAIKNGDLEKKMDIINLQAAELGLDVQDVNNLIDEQRQVVGKQKKVAAIVGPHKTLLTIVCVIAVLVEWLIGARGGISFSTVIWLLLINILTILVIVFGVAFFVNKKIKS